MVLRNMEVMAYPILLTLVKYFMSLIILTDESCMVYKIMSDFIRISWLSRLPFVWFFSISRYSFTSELLAEIVCEIWQKPDQVRCKTKGDFFFFLLTYIFMDFFIIFEFPQFKIRDSLGLEFILFWLYILVLQTYIIHGCLDGSCSPPSKQPAMIMAA